MDPGTAPTASSSRTTEDVVIGCRRQRREQAGLRDQDQVVVLGEVLEEQAQASQIMHVKRSERHCLHGAARLCRRAARRQRVLVCRNPALTMGSAVGNNV
jgi:hypothetical protein